eukprot:1603436-Pleurochrysis_carterae.AAC.1
MHAHDNHDEYSEGYIPDDLPKDSNEKYPNDEYSYPVSMPKADESQPLGFKFDAMSDIGSMLKEANAAIQAERPWETRVASDEGAAEEGRADSCEACVDRF